MRSRQGGLHADASEEHRGLEDLQSRASLSWQRTVPDLLARRSQEGCQAGRQARHSKQEVMAKTDYKSVDEYIAAQPASARPVLERVRAIIRKALPDAEEVISYQIAAYKVGGERVIYLAGWKEHFSLYPTTAPLVAAFGDALAGYAMSKGTIRFPLDGPVPVRLIARIAKFRAREAAERAAKKRARPRKK